MVVNEDKGACHEESCSSLWGYFSNCIGRGFYEKQEI